MRGLRRLLASLRRSGLEEQMNQELRFHLEMQTEEHIRAGLPAEEARRAALRQFGRVGRVKERCREEKRLPLAEAVARDARYAVRVLLRQPLFALAVIATLGLGIGATTAVFTVVRHVLLRPLPFPDPQRMVVLWENDRLRGTERESGSFPDYLDIRARARSYEAFAAVERLNLTITGLGEPERVPASRVTTEFFRVLGLPPLHGRVFSTADHGVVIISEGLWKRRFAAAPDVNGRTLVLDGVPHTIVGVMPQAASSGLAPFQDDQLWTHFVANAGDVFRGRHIVRMLGRLRPDASLESAQAEATGIMAQLEKAYPNDNQGRGAVLEQAHEQLVRRTRRPLQILLGAVALVLLIGCVNVANLLLARLASREREIAIRSAMGAGRGRVLGQLLVEGLVLALGGGVCGLALAAAAVNLLAYAAPEGIARLDTLAPDLGMAAWALSVSLGTALLFAALPALAISRSGLEESINAAGRSLTETRTSRGLRHALVMAEVAFALVLLAGAGLLVKSFVKLRAVDPGYDPRGAMQVTMELPEARYPRPKGWPWFERPELTNFADRLTDAARALPGVEAVAVSAHNPLEGGWTTRVTVAGRPAPPPGEQDEAEFSPVGEGFFAALRIPLLRGRAFERRDDAKHPLVAIVNQAFARRHFPGEDPIGRAINIYGYPRQIVGLAADIRTAGLAGAPAPVMYLPLRQNPVTSRVNLIVRSVSAPPVAAVRRLVWSVDRDLALFDAVELDRGLAASIAERRFTAWLLGAFAVLALLLAAVGIYAVINYSVAQRTREIGVRVAVGASPAAILRSEIGPMMLRVFVGLTAGLAAAIAMRAALRSLLYEVTPADPSVLAGAAALLAVVALAACWLPARRAARVDPVRALRFE
jgi:predicted permease